ncbi:MAG: hypothetical protein ACHQUC_04945 [Chlamydiales bacterium]
MATKAFPNPDQEYNTVSKIVALRLNAISSAIIEMTTTLIFETQRSYLQKQKIFQDILRIVVDEIRKRLIACSPNAQHSQIGAVSFIQYFGKTLNLYSQRHHLAS